MKIAAPMVGLVFVFRVRNCVLIGFNN